MGSTIGLLWGGWGSEAPRSSWGAVKGGKESLPPNWSWAMNCWWNAQLHHLYIFAWLYISFIEALFGPFFPCMFLFYVTYFLPYLFELFFFFKWAPCSAWMLSSMQGLNSWPWDPEVETWAEIKSRSHNWLSHQGTLMYLNILNILMLRSCPDCSLSFSLITWVQSLSPLLHKLGVSHVQCNVCLESIFSRISLL